MKYAVFGFAWAMFFVSGISADSIITDRPDYTESTNAVPVRTLQIETGYTLTHQGGENTHSIGEILFRYGISKGIELRITPPSYQTDSSISGFTDSSLGLKIELKEATDLLPDTSFIFFGSLPTGTGSLSQSDTQWTSKLCLGWAPADKWDISSNLNYSVINSGTDRFSQVAASLSLGHELSESLGMFLEYYGFFPAEKEGDSSHVINTGLAYLVSPDFQVDCRVGRGLSDQSWFLGFGASVKGSL